ncbi:MAG: FadR family transcriptional regulator [Alphaproteobacteria bacterium]|nr:FadR family transcriptional regulator [Alphaproteobacteria bacterium]
MATNPNTLGPVRATISGATYQSLREGIAAGRFPPGSRLPSERDLADRMGVSRPAVREAVRQLVGQGLIEIKPRRGVYVRAAGELGLGDAFSQLIGTDFDRVMELLEVRRALETRSAFLAAQYATAADIDELTRIYADLARDNELRATGDDADVRFHCAIAAAAGNTVLTHMMATLHGALVKAARLLASRLMDSEHYRNEMFAIHTRIFEAIKERKPKAASAAMDAHFAFVQRELTHYRRKSGEG